MLVTVVTKFQPFICKTMETKAMFHIDAAQTNPFLSIKVDPRENPVEHRKQFRNATRNDGMDKRPVKRCIGVCHKMTEQF